MDSKGAVSSDLKSNYLFANSKDNVKVVIRVRPLNDREKGRTCWIHKFYRQWRVQKMCLSWKPELNCNWWLQGFQLWLCCRRRYSVECNILADCTAYCRLLFRRLQWNYICIWSDRIWQDIHHTRSHYCHREWRRDNLRKPLKRWWPLWKC